MSHPADLGEALSQLRSWLGRLVGCPGWTDERIVEIGRGTRYLRSDAGPYEWRIDRSALHGVVHYAPRFAELLATGYAWLNLSCYGVLEGVAIFAVEVPREPAGVAHGRTAVNFSGPPTQLSNWDAAGWISIDD
jgi:hypothetical protein